jgi:hypothetical protein
MPRKAFARFIVVAGVVIGSASPSGAYAQTQPLALATATRIKCVFPIMSTGTWSKEGDPRVDSQKSDLVLQYQGIDTNEGTAEAIGSFGNFIITVRFVAGSLHLLATGDGPIYLTTVFNRPTHPGKFKAVHTRHEFTDVSLPGFTSRPEQYVGECEIVK